MANEKRLIDANVLLTSPLWDYLKEGYEKSSARTIIATQHTVDAVEVVRCKDCKHFIQEEHGCNHFGYYSHTPWVDEVDFCSYGERKGDGE